MDREIAVRQCILALCSWIHEIAKTPQSNMDIGNTVKNDLQRTLSRSLPIIEQQYPDLVSQVKSALEV